jgi:hypothetical protein
MRYWPISSIRHCLTPAAARALDAAPETKALSERFYIACISACQFVPAAPVHGLVLIKDEGSLPKHAFLKRPGAAELSHLERFCICENFDGEMFLMINSSH